MALMFSRVAHNFIKNGYYPTDEDTLSRVFSALEVESDQPMRIADPCCGEGSALAELQNHLSAAGANVESFGIEYNEERAWHAKQWLGRCIHADLNDCSVALRSFSLLFLNPPYGDLVSDSEWSGSSRKSGRKRLEKEFAKRCFPMLQPGGVLVFIVPYSVLDRELASMVSRHFSDVTVYAAPEQQFKQAVVMGVKRRRVAEPEKAVVQRLTQAQQNRYCDDKGDWVEGFVTERVLPRVWPHAPYSVPPALNQGDIAFHAVSLDHRQLAEEVKANPVLWERFQLLFRVTTDQPRPPLRKLSDWHLALLLAAGQVSGVVRSDQRVFLIKGDTHKTKNVRHESELDEKTGSVSVTQIATDRFVPLIRALDFTPNSPTFGRVIHIE